MAKPEYIKQDTEKPMRDYVLYRCKFCGHKYAISWCDVLAMDEGINLLLINGCPRCNKKGQGVEIEDVFGNKKEG